MQFIPYLNFNGECETAFKFYERSLGGTADIRKYGDSPMAKDTPPEWQGRVMHARLDVGDAVLMGSDRAPGQDEQSKGTYVSLAINDVAEAERIFKALADKGSIELPLQETFWAARFGMLVDQFGTPWMINCERAA